MELRDEDLWSAFQGRTLPESAWTHRAHVRVAWLHLARWSIEEAHSRERLFSLRARTVFVEPDLAPLPVWTDLTSR